MAKGLAAGCRVLARDLYLGDHARQILAHLEVAVGANDSELLLLGHGAMLLGKCGESFLLTLESFPSNWDQ